MKKPLKAALWSLFIPGAGLWYCGQPGRGIVNFVIAVLAPLMGFFTGFLGEHFQWLILAIAAGSAGFAHATATSLESPGQNGSG